ncbi:hypothetical protein [Paenibacillus massiliensis]|uniref:hypothetical protein n=1 Tax=Paenibacillus massiliensis TaxID=225917 RepID=UPI00040BB544|nr:hypothetical protein [Paenibacillus massiliensis]
MTAQKASAIIQQYTTAAQALRENTASMSAAIGDGLPDPYQLEQIWAERDVIYLNWHNAAAVMRELPQEYLAQAVAAIELMNGGIA